MSSHVTKGGFTLIEVLLGVMCFPVILTAVFSILLLMSNVSVPKVSAIHILKLQLQQSFIRGSNLRFEDKAITYDYNNQSFLIELDGTRLIRRPGYEILLENVRDLKIKEDAFQICDEEACIEI